MKNYKTLVSSDNRKSLFISLVVIVFLASFLISYGLKPVSKIPSLRDFIVEPGQGFREITLHLRNQGFIRSIFAFKILAFLKGSAHQFKPGLYEISPHLTSNEIIHRLVRGAEEVKVVIPEGLSIYEVDKILSDNKIIKPSSLIDYAEGKSLEGKLFPDTYYFFTSSKVGDVVQVFLKNFESKISPLLEKEPGSVEKNLILASLVQEEVTIYKDQQIVAGIMKKRLKLNMPLQLDSTVCYLKKINSKNPLESCHPVTPLDLKIDSPYNTYLYKGLPPGPIASPGVSAIKAVLESQNSAYLFYLSDSLGQTYFAEDLEGHNYNVLIHLKN